jgi:hypothetical protein
MNDMRMSIFFKEDQLQTKILMLQSLYNESHLKSSFRKFYGRHNDLVCDYSVSLDWRMICFIPLLDFRFHTGFDDV